MNEELIEKIKQEFITKNSADLVVYPNTGRTLENLIHSERTAFAVKAIEFTLNYLEKNIEDPKLIDR